MQGIAPELTFLGINTGFGGSADTHTRGVIELQNTLIRELHSGILPTLAEHTASEQQSKLLNPGYQEQASLGESPHSNYMPESWARASIVVRVNSLASGYSGVRPAILNSMIALLEHDIVPIIPIRGSISASGDLMPLSYVGGALQGDPGIHVWAKSPDDRRRRVTTADVALRDSCLTPIDLEPKEGLALINGTAVSTGVAALAMHDANCLAATSQLLTVMSVEALCGARESFDPIFARLRPHPGQVEVSRNIHALLQGSKLATESSDQSKGSLRQDRYAIRTAAQWIGPVLEDFQLASQQVNIECNSVTDNPLIDVEREGKSFHGGNFQAKAITSAMEKTRLGLQSLGQMMFAQCTELINPKMSFGLPPNLTGEEPSESFILKPLDIVIAALQSELGFLSNSAGSHVQSAEMGNQSLNSLALISARYTHTAIDVLTQLVSAHILALCQAFDLRAMHLQFMANFKPWLLRDTEETLAGVVSSRVELENLKSLLWHDFQLLLGQTTSMNTIPRFTHVFRSLQPLILEAASSVPETIPSLKAWTLRCSERAIQSLEKNREAYFACPDATSFLGIASRRIYRYIRNNLAVPFLRTSDLMNLNPRSALTNGGHQPDQCNGPKDSINLNIGQESEEYSEDIQPKFALQDPCRVANGNGAGFHAYRLSEGSRSREEQPGLSSPRNKQSQQKNSTVGFYISVIYEDIRSGSLYDQVSACLNEVNRD